MISGIGEKVYRRSRVRVSSGRPADRRKMLFLEVFALKYALRNGKPPPLARPRNVSAPFNPTSRNLQSREEASRKERKSRDPKLRDSDASAVKG